jgi:hypothetical protein
VSMPRRRARWWAAAAAAVAALPLAVAPAADGGVPAASAGHGARSTAAGKAAGDVPAHFVGLSVEWSLVERYMGRAARPAFVRLLRNLGSGVLRIGGSSQDVMPFDATAPNTNRIITPDDLRDIRATLDAANAGRPQGHTPAWGVVLGTAMAPVSASRPFVSPAHAHAFVTHGVDPVFGGRDAKDVVGIELGNEPDLSYGTSRLAQYRSDLATYSAADVTGPWPVIAPNTSEDILPWSTVAAGPTRYFWDWPQILDTDAATARARAGGFGAYASDHFYPLARTCTGKPYRCPSTGALLSAEHMDSLDYQAYTHAAQAAAHGLGYRLEETNTAAGRGADQVSNVAASATYALDLMFHAACPQPPDGPADNRNCRLGALGVNFHNAEVNAFFEPEEGNAYYNAVDYDPTAAMGAPQPAPLYYAMLLFSRLAQGGRDLHPVALPTDPGVAIWTLQNPAGVRRTFLINKSARPQTVSVPAGRPVALVDRMTPDDPSASGRTLDAAAVRIDGRQVRADGSWPGLAPRPTVARHRQFRIALGPGEAAVLSTAR